MPHRRHLFLSALLALPLPACADELDEDEALTAWGAVSGTLAYGLQTVLKDVTPPAELDHTFTCPNGVGTARFVGTVTTPGDGMTAGPAWSLTVTVADCDAAETTFDGTFDYTARSVGGDSDWNIFREISGQGTFRGHIEGTCAIDTTSQTAIIAGQPSSIASTAGTVCGHEAGDVFSPLSN